MDKESREQMLEFIRARFPDEDWEQHFRSWRSRQKFVRQHQREWRRQRRWGLRRRLNFAFAFVALAAVALTTWLILGAVFSALFSGAHPGDWMHGPWNNPQFAQAREVFARVTGTAFWAAALAFLLSVAAAAFITQVLIRPLIALTDGAKRLEAGERGIRLRLPRSRDELRALTEAFNNLVAGLERQESWRRDLVADIAHDLRTPLAVLRSEIEAMQDGVSQPDPDGLERLHSQVMHLSKLVDDLRTLSLAEGGGLHLNLKPVELDGFLQGFCENFAAQATQAGMELRCLAAPKLSIQLDAAQMTRVLANLLDNAVRYGAGPLELKAEKTPEDVRIIFRDHGPGLSKEALERVFDRFYRGDASRTRAEGKGGSGLGLSIARAIVEAHGGRLEAANHPEGGAVFTITLQE